MISHVYGKLSDVKIKNKADNFLINGENFNDLDRVVFKFNIKNYFNMVEKYSRMVSIIIQMNPELLGYYGGSVDINSYIDKINDNELVKSCVGGRQIERIPETMGDLVSSEGRKNGRK